MPSVLIVDDSLTVRMDLQEAFASSGFRTELCADAAAARHALAHGGLDLVILDVLLPDESGLDLLADLRREPRTASLPVVLLSTEAEVSARIRGLEAGATDYLGKPYDRGYIVARARELVRRARGPLRRETAPLVLVIDDSATVRHQLREALQDSGFDVVEAATGEEGLKVAFDQRPAAVIIDALLPGMDGASVVHRLRSDAVLRRTPCIVLTAAEEHVGELVALEEGADAYVRKDQGLDFVLTRLRALLRSQSPLPTVEDRSSSVLAPKRILAVDDSPTYLEELASQLQQDGYEVVQATSAEEALRLLAVQQVDCILMDLMMPDMSGQEACRTIKADPSHRVIPLIILTALGEREAMIRAIEAGADDFVIKSSHFQVLRARLRAQLRRTQFEHESRVLAEHERYEQAAEILETIPDAFCAVDSKARILYANGPALELMGRRREEAHGRSLWHALSRVAGPAFREQLEQTLGDGRRCRFAQQLCRSGEPWYEVRAFPRESGFILYLRDITERRKAEEALREADQRKTEFLAMLSHELRNPLTPIRNSLVILDHAGPDEERARRAKDVIGRQVELLTRLVDDLLDVTRISHGKIRIEKSPLELTELVQRTGEDHASLLADHGLTLDVRIHSAPLWVDGDAARLSQAIGNLLQNAAKFTHRGGRVELSLTEDVEGRMAVVQVRDNGVGFDAQVLAQLFEPFEQADTSLSRSLGGLGLGLALVKGLIESHGGDVTGHSEGPGKGAEFVIRLPLIEAAKTSQGPEKPPVESGSLRVLIIEDNADAANSLCEVLELSGHRAEVAYDGPDGLAAARVFEPDVVLCDIGLPGMDGYEVARALRGEPDRAVRSAYLVALTGYAQPEDLAQAEQAGFDAHLPKPPSLEKLEAMLQAAWSRRQGR